MATLDWWIKRITERFKCLALGTKVLNQTPVPTSDDSQYANLYTAGVVSPKGFFSEQMATESDFKLHAARLRIDAGCMKYLASEEEVLTDVVNASPVEHYECVLTIVSRNYETLLACGSYEWETEQTTLSWLQDKLELCFENTEKSRAQELDPREADDVDRFLAFEHAKESLQATLRAARWFQRGIFLCDVIVPEENEKNNLVASGPGVWTHNTSTDLPCIFGFARIIIPCLVVSRHATTTPKTLVVVVVTRCEDKIKFCVCGNSLGHWHPLMMATYSVIGFLEACLMNGIIKSQTHGVTRRRVRHGKDFLVDLKTQKSQMYGKMRGRKVMYTLPPIIMTT